MRNKTVVYILFLLTSLESTSQLKYPVSRKSDHIDNYRGVIVKDPYRWLENDTAAETKAWVAEQNKFTNQQLDSIPFRSQMIKRVSEVFDYPKYSVPFENSGFYYYYKNDGLQNQAVLYRQKGLSARVDKVIDPNTLSKDGTSRLRTFEISRNGHYAVYGISEAGSDWEKYYIRDMKTGKNLSEELQWIKSSGVAWAKDGFYYSRFPKPEPGQELSSSTASNQIWFHLIGTSQEQDQRIVINNMQSATFNFVSSSQDEHYTFIFSRSADLKGNSVFYCNNTTGVREFLPVVKNIGNFYYDVVHSQENKIIIWTNEEAPNSKIMLVDISNPEAHVWNTIIGERPQPIESAKAAGGKLFLTYLKDVSSKTFLHEMSGKMVREVVFPGSGTAVGFDGKVTDSTVFYSFNSFTVPPTIFRYDIKTGVSSIFRQTSVDFDKENYETKQIFYKSKDGTEIPMFIVFRKGTKLDGNNPTLLYGYGGFNISVLPVFSARLIPWLEQGGVYAVANIRGGSEYGEKWHEGGMKLNKQHAFDDFIAAGERLIQLKYTNKEKLAIQGGSNGGLLVGAVINQRPDLFKVAIPMVGVMDMLRFQKFTVGALWISEYGSSDSALDFNNLYTYSPLHNIKTGTHYPATLITTSDHDDRVVPAHSFKYAATLQEKQVGDNPVLIRIDVNSGHGSSNTSKQIAQIADIYSFIFSNMGITPLFKSVNATKFKKKSF